MTSVWRASDPGHELRARGMTSLAAFLMAGAAFLAALYYGQKARRTAQSNPEATRTSLMLSLPFLIGGFALLILGWSRLG